MSIPLEPAVQIRPLDTHDDLREIIPLERAIWGYSDLEIDSTALLTVGAQYAGQILGAFHLGRIIGFSYAVATLQVDRLHSHRVGVHPDFQNMGVGRALKLAQRDYALQRSIRVIQWTFDPLQPRNAYFNIVLLGGIASTYLPNFYGITSSPLHAGLPTDRLLVEWHLLSPRVNEILSGRQPGSSSDLGEICVHPIQRGVHRSTVQARIREQFLDYFTRGYALCGFRQEENSYTYVLERP